MLTRIDTDLVDKQLDFELTEVGFTPENIQKARRAYRVSVGRTSLYDPRLHVKLYTALMTLASPEEDAELRRRAFEILRGELGV